VLYNSYIVEWEITTNIYVTCNIVFAGPTSLAIAMQILKQFGFLFQI